MKFPISDADARREGGNFPLRYDIYVRFLACGSSAWKSSILRKVIERSFDQDVREDPHERWERSDFENYFSIQDEKK